MRSLSILLAACLSFTASAQLLQNPSFETPAAGTYGSVANPTNAGWVFTGDAGIANTTDIDVTFENSIPDGSQVAYCGPGGVIAQTFTNLTPGWFEIRYSLASAVIEPNDQTVQVNLDTNSIGTYTPPGDSTFPFFTTNLFVPSGIHTLSFTATSPYGVALIDAVKLQVVPNLTLAVTNTSVTLHLMGGLTNRTYVLSRKLQLLSPNTLITNLTANSILALPNQPYPSAFYLISSAHD
jgi:hypothetical protein